MNKVTAMLDAAVAVIIDIRSLADSLQLLVDVIKFLHWCYIKLKQHREKKKADAKEYII